ncbi:MAG: thiamine pyrophosphate-dependent dehydrogenase E1 component subunit alpha [Elusimicrobiota bacterium]
MIAKEGLPVGELWRRMLLIRRFEENLLRMFGQGEIFGTTHCCIGQEANAVGIASCLRPGDFVVSNHRCHGHYLARTGDVEGLLAEMMGRSAGVVGGRGGSQHLHAENFISNGILGGGTPIAVGTALAHKLEKSDAATVCFIGDGTFGEGVLYEALNMASLWGVPVLFVVENNHYSQSTPIMKNLAGSLRGRFDAFGIAAQEIESFDVAEIRSAADKLLEDMRRRVRPAALLISTYRFCHHSKNDDARDPAEVARWKKRDPVDALRETVDAGELERAEQEIEQRLKQAERAASESPEPALTARHLDPYFTSDEIR